MTTITPSNPLNIDFANILSIIQDYRGKAVQTFNHASVMTAWHVGAYVSNKIKNAQWGSKVVQQLAEYIHTQDPTLKGWSRRTIYKMVQFYDVYSSEQFIARATTLKLLPAPQASVPTAVTQLDNAEIVPTVLAQIDDEPIVPTRLAQLQKLLLKTALSNHYTILQRCTTIDQYIFYILYSEYESLKTRDLERAIKSDTYSRMLSDKKWQSEMLKATYPQTQLLLKDKAILEFLGLPKQYKESRLRKGIVEHMREFIVELGKDFLFVDEEHALEVGGKTYRCDLLFFHRALQCLVAIELKTTEFDPRDLGQLEFYLEALDQTERRSNENPSIGILMCKDANSEVVRYALNRSMSPTMVAMYEEHLKVGSVLQRSLEEFTDFLSREK
jgi:predicted nuclease of restriction endonuclease-like (RecB) superfamily